MTTKMDIARTVASFIKHHPHGITTADLYKEYGAAFQDIDGGVTRGSAVDLISKALASMVGKGLADFSEQEGGKRLYFTINGAEKNVPADENTREHEDNDAMEETEPDETERFGPQIRAVNVVFYETPDGERFNDMESAVKHWTRKKLEQEISRFFETTPWYGDRDCVDFAVDFLMFRDHGEVPVPF